MRPGEAPPEDAGQEGEVGQALDLADAPLPGAPAAAASGARAADQERAAKRWLMLAEAEEWDTISAPPEVYRFEQLEGRGADPRRTPEYRQQVLEGLGLTDAARFPHLSAEDLGAARKVLA